ncbi:efflux RND transporter periplasmic adaptor subunit [Pseudomonas monteilii]|uniref:Efflux RND transporter periplasmic adaptor subunit n=1 Tax=Pseudomonas monteilii TaxID=76759 RepID=A0A399M998_9PSED|nr:efflux RND transporter periplasmic adaptor subunit [Pseudomonas monteilii]RII77406.1 efflux RND transporter periplasmic adaptor subunit [Pseudomonas monteilii]
MSTCDRFCVSLITAALCTSLSGCGAPSTADPRVDHPPLVSTAVVSADQAHWQRQFTGVVAARVESAIGFRVAGKVAERFVDVGQHVKLGQPLMRLDLADFDLDVRNQQAAVEASHAALVRASADLERLQGLVDLGAVSAKTFDQAQETQRAAQSRWNAANATLSLAKNALRYADLRADVDGVVMRRFADEGQVVAVGQPVLELAQDGAREALIDLPETLRPALGSIAVAHLYADPTQRFVVRLRELSSAADPLTRTYRARYVLDGPSADIPLGSTVIVGIASKVAESERKIPLASIYDRGQGPGVWVVAADNRIHYRSIGISRIDEEHATVNGGVDAGERLVALGVHQLHEGQEVRFVDGQAQ